MLSSIYFKISVAKEHFPWLCQVKEKNSTTTKILFFIVDNFTILEELTEKGFNNYKMAELTGINRTSLSNLRIGACNQPNYNDGVAIMNVYINELGSE